MRASKLKLRQVNKAIMVASEVVAAYFALRSLNLTGYYYHQARAKNIAETDAKLFRFDRKLLDRRRVKRYSLKRKVYLLEK